MMPRAATIAAAVAVVGTVSLVAWVVVPSSASPPPVTPSARYMTAMPATGGDQGFRLIPPSNSRCTGSDITTAVLPQVPGRNGPTWPALVSMQSRRICQLQQQGEVTPLHPDGKAAAPAVILDPRSHEPVTISPGHAAKLVIDWGGGEACTVKPGTPVAALATSFSYNISGMKGRFRLLQPVAACPMGAYLESSDTLDLVSGNSSNYEPIVQVTMTVPHSVRAGDWFVAHATIHYNLTTTTVFDPCPVFWTQISPQSAEAATRYWTLECAQMTPLELGDLVNFSVPLMAPANLASQQVDLTLSFGPNPIAGPTLRSARTTSPALDTTTQLDIQGFGPPLQPVAFVPLPAPPPPVPLQRTVSAPCAPRDLRPGELAPHDLVPGVGIHSDYFTLTNISSIPCTLYSNTLMALKGPGLTPEPVPGGSALFSPTVDGELEPGETTKVQFEFPNSCAGVDATARHFRDVVISLPEGPLVVPRPIDDECGVATGGAGVNVDGPTAVGPLYESYQPIDPEHDGSVVIKAPPALPRGVPTTVKVTLQGQADWTGGCPGYILTIDGIQTRQGLPCTITHILPDICATYRIQVEPPPTVTLGPTTIRFELLSGLVPTATETVTITAA